MTWKRVGLVAAGALAVYLLWYFLKGKKASAAPLVVQKLPGAPTGGDVGDYKAPGEDKLSITGDVYFGSPGKEEFSELKITR